MWKTGPEAVDPGKRHPRETSLLHYLLFGIRGDLLGIFRHGFAGQYQRHVSDQLVRRRLHELNLRAWKPAKMPEWHPSPPSLVKVVSTTSAVEVEFKQEGESHVSDESTFWLWKLYGRVKVWRRHTWWTFCWLLHCPLAVAVWWFGVESLSLGKQDLLVVNATWCCQLQVWSWTCDIFSFHLIKVLT